MTQSENIHTFSGRLATFTAVQTAKRRASSTRKRTAANLSWPHDSPDAESLAKAGFYFVPSSSSPDNVRCFMCDVNLDGWEEGDDAAKEHYAHKPECAMAITCYVRNMFNSDQEIDEDPMSEKYRNARLETFKDVWPHENKRAWKCKSAKLADAGWYFDPEPDADDAVSCPYCNLSIGNWEPKDDPLKEHKKREPSCAFFSLSDKYASTRPTTKGAKKRASKADRSSIQSTMTTSQPEISQIGVPEIEDEVDDSVMTVVSTATTTSKTVKGKKATKGRPKKKIAAIEDNDPVPPTDDSVMEQAMEEEPIKPPPKQTTRKVSRKASTTKKTAARSARGKKRTSDGSVKEDLSQEPVEETPITVVHAPSRGTKRTSDGTPKASRMQDSSIIILEDPPSEKPKPQKRTKKVDTETRSQEVEPSEPTTKIKKAKTSSIRQPLAELNPKEVTVPDENVNTPQSDHNQFVIRSDPPTPTPARTKFSTSQRQSMRSKISTTPRASVIQRSTSSSPQTSDAENKPPSTRRSIKPLVLKPVSPLRPLPANTFTPSVQTSPAKRHIVSRLQTQVAWEPAELDAIFSSFSPSKGAASDNKENRLAKIDISVLDKQRLPGIVESVKANMTNEEKGMTVEQWVRWNAQKAEDRMKSQTEAMITTFEREAQKAQRALEAVQHRA